MDIKKIIPDTDIKNWVGPFEDKNLYYDSGKSETKRYIDLLKIKSNDNVLEIGCGCGRLAIHFSQFLSNEGMYFGIDNNKSLYDYCIEYIKPNFKNFNFYYLDVYNGMYNSEGSIPVNDVHFPLDNSSMDIIIGCSLFTHMLIEDIDIYLKESYRVLKPGGKIAMTYFLLNDKTIKKVENVTVLRKFNFTIGKNSRSLNEETPEEGISHDETKIIDIYKSNNLKISGVYYGGWSDNAIENLQDLIIAKK